MRKIGWVVAVGLVMSAAIWMFAGKPVEGFYGDMVLNNKAEQRGMPPVIFPHWIHRTEFKCKVCHPAIFEMKSGANDIDMEKIVFKGAFCGKCHNGETAWRPVVCGRCHSGKPGMVTGPLHGVN